MIALWNCKCLAALLVALALIFDASVATDVLRQADGSVLYGRLSSESESEFFFQERVDASNYIERRILRDQVVFLVRTVDERRLGGLDPTRPDEYRRLAEELAGWRVDPEAQSLAIRLYLIAARATKGRERRHCLLALVELARSPDERQRLGELAFLLDESISRSIMDPRPTPNEPEISMAEIQELIRAVQTVRRGDGSSVEDIFQRPSSRLILERTREICTLEQLQQAAAARLHSLDELNLLIKLELGLQRLLLARPTVVAGQTWYRQSQDERLAQWKMPDWDNVTEFDPTECVYREGLWQAPGPRK